MVQETFELLRLRTKTLEALGYKVNDRTLSDLRKRFSEDYRKLQLAHSNEDVVYTGAEYPGNLKLPNITILPLLRTIQGNVVAGQTMGHQHTQYLENDSRTFQEIYEFQGYGAMLLRNNSGTRLHVLRPGEKVTAGKDDDMTVINLGLYPLVTLDYANPQMNKAHMKLEEEIGPMFLVQFTEKGMTFKINSDYVAKKILSDSFEVTIPSANAEECVQNLLHARKSFEAAGIQVIEGTNLPDYLRKEFAYPLRELVLRRNKTLLGLLGFNSD